MSSRTPRAATLELVESIAEALRCVSEVGFVARGSQQGGPYPAEFHGRVVTLPRAPRLNPLRLRVAIDYMIDPTPDRRGWWDSRIAGWIYEIRTADDRPILKFHWHPRSRRVAWPHLHAYGVNDAVDLHKLHPPTGMVTAGSVVRFLIEDLGVLLRRPNWQAVLDRHAAV